MRKPLPLILGLVGIALFLTAFVWVYLAAAGASGRLYPWAEEPVRVAGSMAIEVDLWDSGAHADVTCLQCHQEIDPEQLRDAYARGMAIDLEAWLKVDPGRCTECHDPLGADLELPEAVRTLHEQHLEMPETSCTDCHAVHQPVDTRPHQRCLACHEQKEVKMAIPGDVSCAACHLDLAQVTPADHKERPAWLRTHGQTTGSQRCGDCHLSTSAGPHQAPLANPALFAPGEQDACLSCHSAMAMPHPDSFLARHGKEALTLGESTCATCHSPLEGEVAVPQHALPSYCADCHLEPMPHSSSFLAAHGSRALQSPATCEACHSTKNPANPTALHASQTYCANCHDSFQHESGWVARHGAQVTDSCATCHSTAAEESGHNSCVACHNSHQHESGWVARHGSQVTQSCATCHSTQGGPESKNACAACHTGDGQWHPNMWFVKHGKVVETEGDASCLRCHSEVEPSCAKCHSER